MKKFLITTLLLTSPLVYAAPAEQEVAIVTQCRIATAKVEGTKLAETKEFVLLKTTRDALTQIRLSADQAHDSCGYYLNVTDEWNQKTASTSAAQLLAQFTQVQALKSDADPLPTTLRFANQVQSTLSGLDNNRMWADLTYITNPENFTDRSAYSENGLKMAKWLKSTVDKMASQNPNVHVETQLIETGMRYTQPSLVVKIGDSEKAAVIIGAHMDSMGTMDPPFGNKPGADDDGSGSVTVLELTRALLASKLSFDRPIYVMWYAAEERGLVGSKVVAKYFADKNIPVHAVLQLDMTGFVNKDEERKLWLMTDNSDTGLMNFLGTLATAYADTDVLAYTKCGYACSDHASWTQKGIRAAMPTETNFNAYNPNIHTSKDTVDHLSLVQMSKFLKLAVGFAVELAEPLS